MHLHALAMSRKETTVHRPFYPELVSKQAAFHLHWPPSPVALVNEALILLTKQVLLLECPQSDETRQSLTELAENRRQGNGIKPFELPVCSYIQILNFEIAKSQRHCHK